MNGFLRKGVIALGVIGATSAAYAVSSSVISGGPVLRQLSRSLFARRAREAFLSDVCDLHIHAQSVSMIGIYRSEYRHHDVIVKATPTHGVLDMTRHGSDAFNDMLSDLSKHGRKFTHSGTAILSHGLQSYLYAPTSFKYPIGNPDLEIFLRNSRKRDYFVVVVSIDGVERCIEVTKSGGQCIVVGRDGVHFLRFYVKDKKDVEATNSINPFSENNAERAERHQLLVECCGVNATEQSDTLRF